MELIPYRRVVLTYGWEDARTVVPAETTRVEIDLVEADGATTLRIVHHGLPPEAVDDHERGWTYFLGALHDRLAYARALACGSRRVIVTEASRSAVAVPR